MIRVFGLLLVWVVSGAIASAAEIPVRSGAHEDFSRVVLDVSASTEWSIEQDSTGARVRIAGHNDGFDTSSVFQRIDKRFIGAVTSSDSEVFIAFNCNCVAEAFGAGDRMIVVDVSLRVDPATQSGTPENQPDERSAPPTALRFSLLNPPLPSPRDFSDLVLADSLESRTLEPTISELPINSNLEQHESNRSSLAPAREKLAERIGQAATTGLLRPNANFNLTFESERRSQIDTRVFEVPISNDQIEVDENTTGVNLRVTSSSDTFIGIGGGLQQSIASGIVCPDPSVARIQDWVQNSGFSIRIANLRSTLYSELDRVDSKVAREMVQTYLYFGFGAEALELIEVSGGSFEDTEILYGIAEILEFGAAKQDRYLNRFLDCDSDIALWAILSTKDLQSADAMNSSAAIRTLNSLPIHLRRHVAPLLSNKLLAYGDKDGASAALRSLERTAEPLSSLAEIAKADIELSQGNVSAAQDRLRGVVETNGQQSAEALVRYVDTHFDAGKDIEQDIATLVEAYALEFKDSALGDDLRRTHVLALAKSGQFDAAFVALERLPLSGSNDTSADLRSAVLEVLSSDASDAAFAKHAFENMSDHKAGISQSAALRIASRLVELGFFAEAEHALSAYDDIPQTSQNRMLRAKISLGLSRPVEAQAVLRGIKGAEASRLQAEASILAGNHSQAHEILSALGDEANSLDAAWLSNDWKNLINPNVPLLGPASEVASSPVDVSTELDGMLTRLQTTLQDSADARDVIQQLITANESSD